MQRGQEESRGRRGEDRRELGGGGGSGGGGGGGRHSRWTHTRQNDSDAEQPTERPPSRGWRAAAVQDEGEPSEDGELPAEGAAPRGAGQQGGVPGPADAANSDSDSEGGGRKRKHAPVVWHTPPKAARQGGGGGMAHVGSSKGLDALGGGGGGGARTAADRALAELAAFQAQQQAAAAGSGDEGSPPVMKPSPSISSDEGDGIGRSMPGSPVGRPVAGGEGEAHTAPVQPRRASRWVQGADGEEARGDEGGPPAAVDAGSDAEQESGSGIEEQDAQYAGEAAEDEEASPQRPTKRVVNMMEECRSVDGYEKLNRISEGTYGVVYRARDRETGEICALKKVKLEKERDGFPLTSIREINILLSLDHPHIVNVSEVVVGPSLDAVFMVMEYADHDLKAVMEERMSQPFSTAEVKTLMLQLLSGMAYLHDNWVLHRDLKTSNILYTNRGELKLCDFGLARQYGSPLAAYTHMVVTLWYRAPELLLGARKYSTAVDVWSIGCIMAELLSKEALFPGKSEIDCLQMILKTLGSPTEESWPGLSKLPNARKFNLGKHPAGNLRQRFPPAGFGFDGRPSLSEQGFHLLCGLLELCPEKRISCEEALHHPWFREHPLPKDSALMPTFPATNDTTQQRHAAQRRAANKAAAGSHG